MDEMNQRKDEEGGVNLGRHQAQCTICSSPYREQIEQEWTSWHSPQHFAELFDVSRDALYRHAHALDLFTKRRRNITMALEKIIERVDRIPMSGSQIVSAIQTYVKLNSSGKGTEQAQGTNPNELLERMSKMEREAFVRDGLLPDWFSSAKAATPSDSHEGEKESEAVENKGLQ